MDMKKILILNGPNLNMLGTREPEVYGRATLADLEREVVDYAHAKGVEAKCFQSDSEGKLIGKIHAALGKYDGIVYNPGAHTHYSYALRDAVGSIDVPVVEVHLSNVDEREAFRRISVIAPVCIAQVKGLGVAGYCKAIDILLEEDAFERLGEGFEERFEEGASVRVAGKGADCSTAGAQGRDSAPEQTVGVETLGRSLFAPQGEARLPQGDTRATPARSSAPGAAQQQCYPATDAASAPVDFTAPFVEAVNSVDAGLLSFERQAAVRAACERMGIGALLVRDTSNVRWLTAFDGVFDEERAHALLIGGNCACLHTDSRYANAVRTAAAQTGSDILVSEDRVSHAKFAHDALTQSGQTRFTGKLGIEDTITYAEFVKMVEMFQTSGLTPTADAVLGLRAVKDSGELTRLRAAQAITDAAFEHIIRFMKPGMTEREVQLELEDYMLRHGAEALAFRSIVATGANGADPHAVPGSTRLEAGQCVVMDFGAKAFGYCSDMTRTVFLGKPEGMMARAWETLRCANESVEAMLKPGVTGAQAHSEAERVLAEGGFAGAMGHGLGHGVGLDVHELPVLNPRNERPLAPGNVVTVEPGIYLPGQFGMRLEDFGVVTEVGFEVFTQSTHETVII